MRTTHHAVSALVANRTAFFALLEQLEAAAGRSFDVQTIEGIIDSDYAGRLDVEEPEAERIIDIALSAQEATAPG